MKAALRGEDVLCGDESPVNVLGNDIDQTTGEPVPGAPHAVTLRTPDARLAYSTGMVSHSKTSIASFGVLDDWHGYLMRDDYAGWHQFDPPPAAVQQCAAHIIRHCKGALELHPQWQQWAAQAITVLRAASADELNPQLLADLRKRYDKAVNSPKRHQLSPGTGTPPTPSATTCTSTPT